MDSCDWETSYPLVQDEEIQGRSQEEKITPSNRMELKPISSS